MAEDVLGMLDQLELDKVLLGGHLMGGLYGLAFAKSTQNA
jgi:pimeloyl-ACP methyl ester carboxylesterase